MSIGLLASFGVAVGINIYRGEDFTCGCFGVDGGGGSLEMAALRICLLTAMSVAVYAAGTTPVSVDRWLR